MSGNWYVIQIQTGIEDKLCSMVRLLTSQEILAECFIPKREWMRKTAGRWEKRLEVLFPGYLFAITGQPDLLYKELKSVPRFTKLLGDGASFIPLYEEEVRLLSRICGEDHVASASEGYIEGDRITVVEGALAGQEGRIRKIDRHKRQAIVALPLCGREVNVTMALEIVRKT